MNGVIAATVENIQSIVDESMHKLVVFSFTSHSQPQSQIMDGTLTRLANQYSQAVLLANVDCDTQPQIAQYFQIQQLPTIIVLQQGKPVEAFSEMLTDAQLVQKLTPYLPDPTELAINRAQALLEQGKPFEAKTLLSELDLSLSANATKVMVQCCLETAKLDEAKALLATIALADQDSDYRALVAKLNLALESVDSPEIRQLQAKLESEPNNMTVLSQLASSYSQAGRHEEALALIFNVLKRDLEAGDGRLRLLFLDLLKGMDQSDPLCSQYRRHFYSLLY